MSNYNLQSIGIVHSPFLQAMGTPVQPYAAAQHGSGESILSPELFGETPILDVNGGCGTLEIDNRYQEGIMDLDGFSHIWVLFWCNQTKSCDLTVIPYRDKNPHGVFATRSPARPNPIGLSCVRIRAIAGRFIHVAEMDLLHGTPILDIKPYVKDYDVRPVEREGWLEESSALKHVLQADGRFSKSV